MDNGKLLTSLPASSFIKAVNTNLGKPDYLESVPKNVQQIYNKGNNQNPILVLVNLKEKL